MSKKNILVIIKLIPVISAVLSYALVFSSADAGMLTTVTVMLAFLGFVFFFIGRKSAREDRTLRILGRLDLLSSAAIILMYVIVFVALAKGMTDTGDAGDSSYEVEEIAVGDSLGGFSSVDMEGNEVTDAIFGEKDVTVLNVWATFCGPCIEEMPELASLAGEFPDNVQVVGVVIDASPAGSEGGGDWEADAKNIDRAWEICSGNGVKYTNILASESVNKMLEKVTAVPTTFIVDKSGNVICKPFVGADVEGYRKAVEDYLAGS